MTDLPSRPTPPASDADLERALADLGRQLEYPGMTDLSTTVRARILDQPTRHQSWRALLPTRRALAWAALIVALLVGAVLLLPDGTRRLIAQRLGLPGVSITDIEALPGSDLSRFEGGTVPGDGLDLGTPVKSLAEAASGLSFAVLQPTLPELSAPDAVYLTPRPLGGHVALVYSPRAGLPNTRETKVGLLFTQFRGTLEPTFFGKGLPRGTRLEQVTVAGRPAYWISGDPHFFIYRDQNGRQSDERFRLAANVLLWEQDGLTLRLEGAFSKEQALRIATSVR